MSALLSVDAARAPGAGPSHADPAAQVPRRASSPPVEQNARLLKALDAVAAETGLVPSGPGVSDAAPASTDRSGGGASA